MHSFWEETKAQNEKWKFLMVVVMLIGRMIVLISMLVISQKKLKWNETDGKWVGKIGNCIQREWIRCDIFVWYREMDENGKYLYHVMCHAPEHFRVFYLYLCISLPEWLVPWCEGHIYFTVTFTSLEMERTLLLMVVLVVWLVAFLLPTNLHGWGMVLITFPWRNFGTRTTVYVPFLSYPVISFYFCHFNWQFNFIYRN